MTDQNQEPCAAPLTVTAFGITDTGRVRSSNEDQFLIAELTKTMRIRHTSLAEPKLLQGDERGHLFLVADGMGGHRAGEQASALAVIAIEQFTLNTFKWFFHADGADAQRVLTQFQAALREADSRILEESAENPDLSGMGTTLTMAYYLDAQLCVVHVGDSRAYLFANGALHQVTHDHTLVAEMVDRGTPARGGQASPSPQYHHQRGRGNEALVNVEAHALEVRPRPSPLCRTG